MPASYNLGSHFERFISDMVASGRYANRSEVVRDGLRLLQDRVQHREVTIDTIQAEVQKGIDAIVRGEYTVFEGDEELKQMFEDIKQQGRKQLDDRSTD